MLLDPTWTKKMAAFGALSVEIFCYVAGGFWLNSWLGSFLDSFLGSTEIETYLGIFGAFLGLGLSIRRVIVYCKVQNEK